MSLKWPAKDPDAYLDYEIDWSAWLGTDTIATSTWTLPSGISSDANSNTTTTTTIWLSGGTAGDSYAVLNEITTAGGRIDERTIHISVKEK